MSAFPILGQVIPFAGNFAPTGWAMCNGQLLSIQQNTALFSLIGTTYGGNGISTFQLPDLRGRAIIGASQNGFPYDPGMVSGENQVQLTLAEIPSHNHSLQASTTAGTGRSESPVNKIFAANTEPTTGPKMIFAPAGTNEVTLAVGTNIGYDGANLPHNNIQPYLAINYIIALQGLFPSRP